jgi:hypothetical protein
MARRSCGRLAIAALVSTLMLVAASASQAVIERHITISSDGGILTGVEPEPANCFGPLSVFFFLVTLINNDTVDLPVTLSATMQPGAELIPDSCSATGGVCTIQDAISLTWSGTIPADSAELVRFFARVNSDVPAGTQLCAVLTAQFGTDEPVTATSCLTTNNARQCGLGAPALGPWAVALLAALLLLTGTVLIRRRA